MFSIRNCCLLTRATRLSLSSVLPPRQFSQAGPAASSVSSAPSPLMTAPMLLSAAGRSDVSSIENNSNSNTGGGSAAAGGAGGDKAIPSSARPVTSPVAARVNSKRENAAIVAEKLVNGKLEKVKRPRSQAATAFTAVMKKLSTVNKTNKTKRQATVAAAAAAAATAPRTAQEEGKSEKQQP